MTLGGSVTQLSKITQAPFTVVGLTENLDEGMALQLLVDSILSNTPALHSTTFSITGITRTSDYIYGTDTDLDRVSMSARYQAIVAKGG